MVLQKRFLPIVFKVWEPRSFHGNGLFSRAESAAYANFKVPIVEEPLKQKEKSPTPYLENHFMALYKQSSFELHIML